MRFAAAAMILASALILGARSLGKKRRTVQTLETLITMIGFISSVMRFDRSPVDELVSAIAEDERFAELSFIFECRRLMESGKMFREAFAQSVEKCAEECGLSAENAARLRGFGSCLGTTDAEGQLSACELYSGIFTAELKKERESFENAEKLIPGLSLLAGLAAAVLMI